MAAEERRQLFDQPRPPEELGLGQFLGDVETRHALEADDVAAVAAFTEFDDAARATGLVERRIADVVLIFERLDHADHAAFAERHVGHRQIARLEDVERQHAARQQQRAGERKQHQAVGQRMRRGGHANKMVESRRRAATVSGSASPMASKNFSSWRRAASSFHVRSRLMISNNWSIAFSRSPAANSATARSSRAWWSLGSAASRASSLPVSPAAFCPASASSSAVLAAATSA